MNGDDLAERVIRLEAERDALPALLKAEMRGYLDGQVRSINHNVELNRETLERRIGKLETTVWGPDGGNGMRQNLRRLWWLHAFLWMLVGVIGSAVGIKVVLPLLP